MLRGAGGTYFNPDEVAAAIRQANPAIDVVAANSEAWRHGTRLLERAIDRRLDFAFETTLGGSTITALLERAAAAGFAVRVWYVALTSPELHLERIRERVANGGHDIPEGDVRRRYDASRENLLQLLPVLDELVMFDNSTHADPRLGHTPTPRLVLRVRRRRIVGGCPLAEVPGWAKPIVMAAINAGPPKRSRAVTVARPRRPRRTRP